MTMTVKGSCTGEVVKSCTLEPSPAHWIRNNYGVTIFFAASALIGILYMVHTVKELRHRRITLWSLVTVFTFAVSYISCYLNAVFFLSDPQTLISMAAGSTVVSSVFTVLLYSKNDLPDWKRIRIPLFLIPATFIIFFTYILKFNAFNTNGMIAIWLLLLGLFIYWDTDFAKNYNMVFRDYVLAVFFIYFEFIVFIYCLCT